MVCLYLPSLVFSSSCKKSKREKGIYSSNELGQIVYGGGGKIEDSDGSITVMMTWTTPVIAINTLIIFYVSIKSSTCLLKVSWNYKYFSQHFIFLKGPIIILLNF